jgi:hypothetical protein
MTQGPQPQPESESPNIGDKLNSLANKLFGKGLDTLAKKVDNGIEYVDNIDVPAILEEKLNTVSNTASYVTDVVTDKDQMLGIGKGLSDELENPQTNKILQDLTSNVVKTSGDAAINALPAVPVFGALAAAAIRAGPNITHALDSFNKLVENYTEKLDKRIGDNITSATTIGATGATTTGNTSESSASSESITNVKKTQIGGFKLKGILRRSKTIEKRTSESIDKFLNPKKKTERRKKTNKRRLSKNKTRKRVRFRL